MEHAAPPPSLPQLLDQAIASYRHGRLRQALSLTRQGLEHYPLHGDLLNVAAAAAKGLGLIDEAERYWRTALKAQPAFAEAHNNLGNLLKECGRAAEAEAAYRQALALCPQCAQTHNNLGLLLHECGRSDEAEAAYRQALALHPHYAEAHYNLGNLLKARGQSTAAEAAYRRALALRPHYAEAHNNLGNLLKERGQSAAAEAAYRQALALHPHYAEAHNNLGNLLKERGQSAAAEAAYRRVLTLRPRYAEAHYNLANLLKERGQAEAAEAAYRQALAIRPQHAKAHHNLGLLLQECGRAEEAEAAYRQALAIHPHYAEARFNLGLLLLSMGRLEQGWAFYESRYDPARKERLVHLPSLPYPQWNGESLAGKALLILPEQGYGDQIQFCRYATELKKQGAARIDIQCAAPLASLFETIAGIDTVIPAGDATPSCDHDFWTLALSIPLQQKTGLGAIPATLPYLYPSERRIARWAPRLPSTGIRVALVWKGSKTHRNDAERSLPGLHTLAPLWSVPGVSFVSLQKGAGEDEATTPPGAQPLLHLGSALDDFADTAAIVSRLDLVICVDTSIAHLAGALGKECWVLLPQVGTDWRWLRERTDSPWYPGVMRLFRQTRAGDWATVVEQVVACLRKFAHEKQPNGSPPTHIPRR